MDRFVADFETTTIVEDCRVWAYAIADIDSELVEYGTSLDAYMESVQKRGNVIHYFHNLKFDGEFIIAWLFNHGFTWVKEKQDLKSKTFTTLISDKGAFFSMEIVFKKKAKHVQKLKIYDSLKLLPFSVAEIAKGFHLPIMKGEIDYRKPRPEGYQPDVDEWAYIKNDVLIVAKALKTLLSQGLDKMTIGSNALQSFKDSVPNFDSLFPIPHYDDDVRRSYRGGFTYLNPRYANKEVGPGIVLDVNSLYPSVMKDCPMPFGEPIYFEGKYQEDPLYNLYVVMLTCNFEVKPDHVPTIQIKNSLSFVPTEYLTSSDGDDVTLVLTSVDLKLFFDHYEVTNVIWEGGYKFKSTIGIFDNYINKWSEVKINSKKEGNAAMYTLAKLMLNNLYGKFALNPATHSKIPKMIEGVVKYELGPQEIRDAVYIPVGSFITAFAREKTIRAAQILYDRFIYADTDSLHLEGLELPDLAIDDTLLGAWKWEGKFSKARYIRAKTYIEMISDPKEDDFKLKVTCAGMPKTCYDKVTFSNFRPGARYSGKLVPKHVPGGIVLQDIDFTILHDKL